MGSEISKKKKNEKINPIVLNKIIQKPNENIQNQ